MPKVTKDHENARKHEILRAAALCFSRAGYRHTGMTDIASEAGLSVGALYKYFPGKDALFRSLFVNAAQENKAVWEEASKRKTPLERLRFVVDLHFDALGRNDCLWALALDVRLRGEALDDQTLADQVRRTYDAQISELSKLLLSADIPGRKTPKARRNTGRAAALAIIALINEARYQALIGDRVDRRLYKTQVLDIGCAVIAGLKAGA